MLKIKTILLMLILFNFKQNYCSDFAKLTPIIACHALCIYLLNSQNNLTAEKKIRDNLVISIGSLTLAALRIKNFNKTDYPNLFSEKSLKYCSIAHITLMLTYGAISLKRLIKKNI